MQFRIMLVTGTMLAALVSAGTAQAYLHTDDAALAKTVNNDSDWVAEANQASGPFEKANEMLKSVGHDGLESEPDESNMLRSSFDLTARDVVEQRPRVWLPAASDSFSDVWPHAFGQKLAVGKKDPNLTRRKYAPGPRLIPVTAGQEKPDFSGYGIIGVEESGFLSLMRSLISAVQTGVGSTVEILRGFGGADRAPV